MASVCIIGVYFGRLPDWFNLWMKSVEYNETVDFIIVTDNNIIDSTLDNLRIIKSDLKSFKQLAEDKLGMKIKLESPYKLCDYKEVYGLILEDEIKEYDYWGECDFDVVFGDLRYYFDKYKLDKYDKFLNRGHLSLYRNTPEVINRYKNKGSIFGSYKEVFKSNMSWAFDETMGINSIYETNGYPFMNEFIYVDVDVNYNDFRLVNRPGLKNYRNQIFYWSEGKLYRDYFDGEVLKTDEFAYIHLQKRKLPCPVFSDDTKSFYITNSGFVEKSGGGYDKGRNCKTKSL